MVFSAIKEFPNRIESFYDKITEPGAGQGLMCVAIIALAQ